MKRQILKNIKEAIELCLAVEKEDLITRHCKKMKKVLQPIF